MTSITYIVENDESLVDKVLYKMLWSNLVAELNAMGPEFTESEWKSKLSHHKYNKKRKQSCDVLLDNRSEQISQQGKII